MTFSFVSSQPISTGSLAIDASLVAGGILRKGAVCLYAEDMPLHLLCAHVIKSNQAQREQALLIESGMSLDAGLAKGVGADLIPRSDGAGITKILNKPLSEQVESGKALLGFGAFSLLLLLVNEPIEEIESDLKALMDAASLSGAACLVATSAKSYLDSDLFIGKVAVESVDAIPGADQNETFGWRVSGHSCATLPQHDVSPSPTYFSTLITADLAVYKPYDLVAAGLVAGVLGMEADGVIHSKGRKFTDSFDEAVQRLMQFEVQARLHSAVIESLPFIRL